MRKLIFILSALLMLAACGDSGTSQSTSATPPVRKACSTPEQAGQRAQEITQKLAEARKNGRITQDQYVAFTNALSNAFSDWATRQNLKAYCAVLDRIVKDANLN